MLTPELKAAIDVKVSRMGKYACEATIHDCMETLKVGKYAYSDPYSEKLWYEIDKCRNKIMQLTKW